MRKLIVDKLSKLHPLEVLFRGTLLSLGMLFLGFAAWQAMVSIGIVQTYDRYTAAVKRCRSDGAPSARFNFYECDVTYRSAAGRHSASVDKLLFSFDEGDEVEIYIDRGEQYSIKPGGFVGLWAIPTLLTIMGTLFVGFGVWPIKTHKG